MDSAYKKLFTEMCHTTAVLAEQVMDYDKKQGDTQGYNTAEVMRNDYQKLEDNLTTNEELTYNEYTKLLAASYIIINNIQDRIKASQQAINNYKIDVIPKLSRIIDETKDDPEKTKTLAKELFKISEN